MSWRATAWAKAQRAGLDRGEKYLLLILSDYHNDEQDAAWPSVPSLAEDAMLKERQTRTLLHSLQRKGFIIIEPKAGPFGANLYRFNFERDIAGVVQKLQVQKLHDPGSPATGDRQSGDRGGAIATAGKPPIEPPIEPPLGITMLPTVASFIDDVANLRGFRTAFDRMTPKTKTTFLAFLNASKRDLAVEAIKMADWLESAKGKNKPLSPSRIMNWLDPTKEQQWAERNHNGRTTAGSARVVAPEYRDRAAALAAKGF